jgi:hypothetical protein
MPANSSRWVCGELREPDVCTELHMLLFLAVSQQGCMPANSSMWACRACVGLGFVLSVI